MSSPLFCVRCGYPNVQGQSFCPNCGNPVYVPPSPAAAGTPVPAASPLASPPAAPPYPAAPPAYPYGYPGYGPPPKRVTIGGMLEGTFSVYFKDLLVYVAAYFFVAVLTTGTTLLLTFLAFRTPSASTIPASLLGMPSGEVVLRMILLVIAVAVVGAVVGAIVVATLTRFAVQRYRGTPETLSQAFAHGLRRFLSVLGAQVLVLLLFAVAISIPLGLLIVGGLAGDIGLVLGGAFLLLILVIVLVYVYVALSLYAPAIVMEDKGAIDGLVRSWELTRGHRLSIFVAALIIGILVAVVTGAVDAATEPFHNEYVAALGAIIVASVTSAWGVIFAGVAYHLIVTEPKMYYGPPPPYVPAPTAPPPR